MRSISGSVSWSDVACYVAARTYVFVQVSEIFILYVCRALLFSCRWLLSSSCFPSYRNRRRCAAGESPRGLNSGARALICKVCEKLPAPEFWHAGCRIMIWVTISECSLWPLSLQRVPRGGIPAYLLKFPRAGRQKTEKWLTLHCTIRLRHIYLHPTRSAKEPIWFRKVVFGQFLFEEPREGGFPQASRAR